MHTERARVAPRSICVLIAGILGCFGSRLEAGDPSLRLEDVVVYPGREFSALLVAGLDRPIRGFQVGIGFSPYALDLREVTLDGTDLAGLAPETFDVRLDRGEASVKILYPLSIPPVDPVPAGPAVRLARLRFQLTSARAGETYGLHLIGTASLTPLVFEGLGFVPPDRIDGSVTVVDRNVLRIGDVGGVKVGQPVEVPFLAMNTDSLQGFSIGVRFDPSVVRFLDVDIRDTVTQQMGAEYVAPIIDGAAGTVILGVLLDFESPFENQQIPPSADETVIARGKVEVIRRPAAGQTIDLVLEDGVGSPPIDNLFVVSNQSVAPVRLNGRLEIVGGEDFIRGDVNGDLKVDISDPIVVCYWLFHQMYEFSCKKAGDSNDDGALELADALYTLGYLFLGSGKPPAPPFPAAGSDPTPDELPCPEE